MNLIDHLFLFAFNIFTPQEIIGISLLVAASLINTAWWLKVRGVMVQRPWGLVAIAASFVGTATFYVALLMGSPASGDITRGASRILWMTLCLSTLHTNGGAAAMTLRCLAARLREKQGAWHG